MLIKLKSFLIFLFIVLVNNNFSQSYNVKHFPPQFQGLSANCHKIIQDRNGYLWIATEDGLCQFDGQDFKLYNTDEGLKRHEVYSIAEGSSGEILVSTRGGISKIKDYKPYDSKLDSLPVFSLKTSFEKIFYDK